jgi:glycosyltransferase involved in cell wall biosynthesis
MAREPELSVVIPVYNEAPNIAELYRELTATLESWGRPYELVLIDDGSTDQTFDLLARLQAGDERLRVIRLRRNFGQTAAFSAGFAHARGRYIVTADGDLQNDPAEIPGMIALLERGNDIVCGWRKDRRDTFLTRRVPSTVANWLISRATGVRLHDYGCSLKAFRAEVVKPLKLYGEMHRFIPAIASEIGVNITEVVVNHRPRTAGRSKYGLSRTIRVILDLITVKFFLSYSTRPLQIFGLIGMASGVLGLIITSYLAYVRLFGYQSISNRPLLLFGILLIFTGVQLLTLGLLAELQSRTYHESQDKPTYFVREIRESQSIRAGATAPEPSVLTRTVLAAAFLAVACLDGAASPAARPPRLAVAGPRLSVEGTPQFLRGVSLFDALGPTAPRDEDLDALARAGLSLVRVWAHWHSPIYDRAGALTGEGRARLLTLVDRLGARGLALELVLLRPGQLPGQPYAIFADEGARLRAVEELTRTLKPHRHVIFDLYNEHDHPHGAIDHQGLKRLRDGVKAIDPDRLVTVSSTEYHFLDAEGKIAKEGREALREEAALVAVDLVAVHFPRSDDWAEKTGARVRTLVGEMESMGVRRPLYLNEPERARDERVIPADRYVTAASGARDAGAAGWVLHTDAGYDLGAKPFLDALRPAERTALGRLGEVK